MLSAKLTGPYILIKGQPTTITCPVYEHSALHHATSGTYQIVDHGFIVKESGSVTIVDHTATLSTSTSLPYGDRYRILFEITLSDGRKVRPENELYVARQSLYPVITEADLYARSPGLDPASSSPHSSYDNYTNFLDEAWNILMNRLISAGNRPHLILSNTALRESHITLTLALIYTDFATRLNTEWETKSEAYMKAYHVAYDGLSFRYEDDPQANRRKSATPSFWLK
jgi:hypothetical protein